jgi:hypothetical protein
VQVIAPEERDPPVSDATEIVDVEEPARRLVVTAAMLAQYRRRLDRHVHELRAFCVTNRLPFLQIDSSASFKAQLALFEASGIFGVSG